MSLSLNVTEVKSLLQAQTNWYAQQPWEFVNIAQRVCDSNDLLQQAYGKYREGNLPLSEVRTKMHDLRRVLRTYRELRDGVYDPAANLS